MAETPRWWTFVTRASEAWWVVTLNLVAFLARLPVFFRSLRERRRGHLRRPGLRDVDGQWLYVGAVDHKPPLIASAYAMVLGVAGRQGINTVHAVSILVVVATALLIGLLVRRLGTGRAAARAASAVYVFWASIGPAKDMLAANGELLMALPAVAALAIALPGLGAGPGAGKDAGRRADGEIGRRGGDALRWMGAGALVVVSALFRYQGAAIAAPLALLAFYDRRPAGHRQGERRVGQSLARLAAAAFGGLVVLAVFVGLYWRQGELPALVFWAWDYPLRYAGSLAAATFAFNAAKMTGLWLLSFRPGRSRSSSRDGASFTRRRGKPPRRPSMT